MVTTEKTQQVHALVARDLKLGQETEQLLQPARRWSRDFQRTLSKLEPRGPSPYRS